MTRLIALTGPAGSGKSTLALQLTESRNFIRKPFSGYLKAMLRTFLTEQKCNPVLIDRMIDGDLKEEPTPFFSGRSPRYAMQTLGTEWRNTLSRDLWIDAWEEDVTCLWVTLPEIGVVVDDLRFPHEAERVRKLGGALVEIRRPGVATKGRRSHVSERMFGLLKPEFVIDNLGSPDDMLSILEAQQRLFPIS